MFCITQFSERQCIMVLTVQFCGVGGKNQCYMFEKDYSLWSCRLLHVPGNKLSTNLNTLWLSVCCEGRKGCVWTETCVFVCVWNCVKPFPRDYAFRGMICGALMSLFRPCNSRCGAYFIGRSRLKKLSGCPLLTEWYTIPSGGVPA